MVNKIKKCCNEKFLIGTMEIAKGYKEIRKKGYYYEEKSDDWDKSEHVTCSIVRATGPFFVWDGGAA